MCTFSALRRAFQADSMGVPRNWPNTVTGFSRPLLTAFAPHLAKLPCLWSGSKETVTLAVSPGLTARRV